MGIAVICAAHDVAGVEGDKWFTRLENRRARSQTEIGPDNTVALVTSGLGAEHRPPGESPVEIGSGTQHVSKRYQPPACQRGQRSSRSTMLVVRPHDVFGWPCQSPFVQCFAPNERAKHLALDQARSAAGGDARNASVY